MIEYQREEQIEMMQAQGFLVKVIGVGGAGSNVLDQIALDGMDDAELICMNTDVRTLKTSTAHAKVQIGKQLTRGLGAGGDPELGILASEEAEEEIRSSVRGQDMVFICTGLGGGTGSGAAPTVSRIAKEEGAFVVVFATMPFSFEGRRRIQQAETALKLLERSADALITFENDRMGELVLPKEGIQQAFSNADKIISQSVRAITNVVTQPGLIQIGMDDLLTALKTPTSRCLFGYGEAKGKNRAQEALKIALRSPLLDRGKLLGKSRNALVHVVGGPSMTLYEVELLMNQMSKNVGSETQILFGSATDEKMEDRLSVTIISSLTLDDLRRHHSSIAHTETIESPAGYVTSLPEADEDLSDDASSPAADEDLDQEEEHASARPSHATENGASRPAPSRARQETAEASSQREERERRQQEREERARQEAQAQRQQEIQAAARRRQEEEAKAQASREANEASDDDDQDEVTAADEDEPVQVSQESEVQAALAQRRQARTGQISQEETSSVTDNDPAQAQDEAPEPTASTSHAPEENLDDDDDDGERARREAFERHKAGLKRDTRPSEPSEPLSARPTAEELMRKRREAQEELKRKREELERLLKMEDEAKRKRPSSNLAAQNTHEDADDEDESPAPAPSPAPNAQRAPQAASRSSIPPVRKMAPTPGAPAAAPNGPPRPSQAELQLEPVRGRFEKAAPTLVDGENLDVPTFFRKRAKKP